MRAAASETRAGAPPDGSPAHSETTSRPSARSTATRSSTSMTSNGGTCERRDGWSGRVWDVTRPVCRTPAQGGAATPGSGRSVQNMDLGLHLANFTWSGGSTTFVDDLVRTAKTAEDVGFTK